METLRNQWPAVNEFINNESAGVIVGCFPATMDYPDGAGSRGETSKPSSGAFVRFTTDACFTFTAAGSTRLVVCE